VVELLDEMTEALWSMGSLLGARFYYYVKFSGRIHFFETRKIHAAKNMKDDVPSRGCEPAKSGFSELI
jgi:hypothetical protein